MKTSICKDTMHIRLISENEKDRRFLTRMRAKIFKVDGACIALGYTGYPKNQRTTDLSIPLHYSDIYSGIKP
jgi:hypothetical protein